MCKGDGKVNWTESQKSRQSNVTPFVEYVDLSNENFLGRNVHVPKLLQNHYFKAVAPSYARGNLGARFISRSVKSMYPLRIACRLKEKSWDLPKCDTLFYLYGGVIDK